MQISFNSRGVAGPASAVIMLASVMRAMAVAPSVAVKAAPMLRCSVRRCTSEVARHKEQLHRDGYTILPAFVSSDQVRTLRERAVSLVEQLEPEEISIFTTKDQGVCSHDDG